MFTDHKQKNLIWDVLYLTSNPKVTAWEHGPEIVFIKCMHKTIADQSHGLSMTPVSIEQLRATLGQKSIRSKSSQRQNWMAVSNTMVQTKSKHQQTWRLQSHVYKPRKRGWNILSKRDSKAQNKDQRSIVTACTINYKGFAFSTHWEHNSAI